MAMLRASNHERIIYKGCIEILSCTLLTPGADHAARGLGQLSGPLRDEEVLLAQLQAQTRRPQPARQQQLDAGYGRLLASPELQEFFAALDRFLSEL